MKDILLYGKWTITWNPIDYHWVAVHSDGRKTVLQALGKMEFEQLDELSTAFHICQNKPAASDHPCMFTNVWREDGRHLRRGRCIFCGRELPE